MKRKDVLIILIPTFIFAVLWIIFSIHHAVNTPTITENTSMQISPISPSFDNKTIDALKKREIVTPLYEIPGASNNLSPTLPTPTPSVSLNSSSSASQATSGGVLQ